MMIYAKHMAHIAQAASVCFGFQGAVIIQYPAKLKAYVMVADGKAAFLFYFVGERLSELPVFVQVKHFLPVVFDTIVFKNEAVTVKYFTVNGNISETALVHPMP